VGVRKGVKVCEGVQVMVIVSVTVGVETQIRVTVLEGGGENVTVTEAEGVNVAERREIGSHARKTTKPRQ